VQGGADPFITDFKHANLKAGLNKDSDPPVAALNEPQKDILGIIMKMEKR